MPEDKEHRVQISVRLTEQVRNHIQELADTSFRSISQYVEMVLVEHLLKVRGEEPWV